MPNEITALEGSLRDGVERFTLFFLRDIAAPAQVAGANVVPTPATGPAPDNEDLLPALARSILDIAEITNLDTGTQEWGTVTFVPIEGMTNPQLITEARRIYAAWRADREATYEVRYRFAGSRINET